MKAITGLILSDYAILRAIISNRSIILRSLRIQLNQEVSEMRNAARKVVFTTT